MTSQTMLVKKRSPGMNGLSVNSKNIGEFLIGLGETFVIEIFFSKSTLVKKISPKYSQ